ncbi:MAG TPA: hypothetical protein VGR72_07095 [Candidatus Acidoferrales bacterium]|nr:hypothetical protein [Candidatus Acidoferrales bacterium]
MTTGISGRLDLLVDAQAALANPQRLTRCQLKRVGGFFRQLDPAERERYFSELLLWLGEDLLSVQTALDENRSAIKEFDQSSRKLTKWLIGFTIALVFLTAVLAAPILVHVVQWLMHRW